MESYSNTECAWQQGQPVNQLQLPIYQRAFHLCWSECSGVIT